MCVIHTSGAELQGKSAWNSVDFKVSLSFPKDRPHDLPEICAVMPVSLMASTQTHILCFLCHLAECLQDS